MAHVPRLTVPGLVILLEACSPAPASPWREQPSPAAAAPGWVVVELFTSEGCSSCPPADRRVRNLARERPVPTEEHAGVLALGFHVDYWDDLGWPDRHADAAHTRRQRSYAPIRERRGLFTPEAVVNGSVSIGGSRWASLDEILATAGRRPQATLGATCRGGVVVVQIRELPPESGNDRAELLLAITERGLRSEVLAGENAGRVLEHAPVVRTLTHVGPATLGEHEIDIEWDESWKHDNLSFVALVQEVTSRRMVGATKAQGCNAAH